MIQSGIRERLSQDQLGSKKKGRRDIAANYGFRKFVHTVIANNKVSPEVREMLLGHSISLSGAYYKSTEKEMLSKFMKVVNYLTINNELGYSQHIQELKEKDDYQKYVIDKKMEEKDDQIKELQDSINFLTDTVNRVLLTGESVNKIITNDDDYGGYGIVKGIELKSAIKHKAVKV